jgi:hypothetical protein
MPHDGEFLGGGSSFFNLLLLGSSIFGGDGGTV